MGDSDLYTEYFTGGLTYTTQNSQLEISTKQDTLSLSSNSASTSQQQLDELGATKGYESLTNTGTPQTTTPTSTSTGTIPSTALSGSSSNTPPGTPPGGLATGSGAQTTTTAASNPGTTYRYPLNVPDLGYDFIKITSYEYISNMAATSSLTSATTPGQSVSQRYTHPLETIYLPMQPNISETNSTEKTSTLATTNTGQTSTSETTKAEHASTSETTIEGSN